jgi:adenine-specific DNA-methyltransferase
MLPSDNVILGSAFKQTEWFDKFDYVIGNPPYVRIHNLMPETKKEIEQYSYCFGMYDLYYAFYEIGQKFLKPTGSLLYISPLSFIQNASGKKMREDIEKNNLLWYFEDLTKEQLFDGFSTYTGIVGLSKVKTSIQIPWSNTREKVGLSYESLQNGIATLADRIFIKDNFNDLEDTFVHPIIKAGTQEWKECIVPPHTEEELKSAPKTYAYMLANKEQLKNRSITGNTKWFEFGRSQGLANMNKEKLVISTTITPDKISYIRVGPEVFVYSGLYATADDLDKLEAELNSPELLEYLIENGKPMRGGYYQITSTMLKNY